MVRVLNFQSRIRTQNCTILGGKICGVDVLLNAANCGKTKYNFTFWVLNFQSNLLETFSMNNKIHHVTWGFGNVWITLSTFSSIGLNETHPRQLTNVI